MAQLLPQHLVDLRRSGLTDETINGCRYSSLIDPAIIAKHLNWKKPADTLGPCLAFPFAELTGAVNGYARMKPDKPRVHNGKPAKYESPKGGGNRAYFPLPALPMIQTPTAPLLITEGEKKSAAATQAGFPTIGLTGAWNWQKKRNSKKGRRELIKDLAAVDWKGRPVFIVFDSDITEKPDILWAEYYLAEALTAAGANVKAIRLSGGPNGEKVGIDDFLVAHGDAGPAALRKLLEKAEPVTKPQDPRPEVLLSTREDFSISAAIAALAKCDREIYQRGNVLVRLAVPKRAPARSKITRSGAPISEPIPTANLRARITQHANVITVNNKDGTSKIEPAHPPPWLVNGVEAAGDYPGIRVLEGIVSTPVLLADGRVLQIPGYDLDNGLLFVPQGEFKSILESPSKDDALAALGRLLDVVCDFPFEQPEHLSAWVAALLTALSRHAFSGPAPLFLVDANIRGSGKGKCLNVISTIVSLRNFATAPYTIDNREFAKTVTALALAGENYVLLDNVVGNLGSSVLDMALTSTEWQGRILGESRQPRLPLNMIWFATANNAIIVGDTPRRICPIRLRSSDEAPEERTGFKYKDLIAHVSAHRCDLLADALTILKAYFVAGRPTQAIIQWGSFESWSELICGCIVWLGLPDPGLARKEASNRSDSDAIALRSLIAGWQELDPDCHGKTARQAIESLKGNLNQFPKLREALSDVFDLPFGKLPTPLKLGQTIRRFRDRIAGNLYFHGEEAHGGVVKWSVREARPRCTPSQDTMPHPNHPNHVAGGDGGVGGVVSSSHKISESENSEAEKYLGEQEHASNPTIPTIPSNDPEWPCRAIEADQGLPQGSLKMIDP
ncbi:MAG: DUF3854 domain-containing protein [Gemmataceae bacterium]